MFLLFFCLFGKSAPHKKVALKEPCQATKQLLVLDVDTNEIIQSCGAHTLMAPSSMTKILTALYTLELIKQGKISLDEIVTVPQDVYKTEGSIFLMAPLHHHFEQQGLKESTIVIRFWIVAVLLSVIGLSLLKLR